MSDLRPTCISRPFAGRDRLFDIAPLGTIEALERACGAGMGEILGRLERLQFRHADIRETIRLGLAGAGMSDQEATALVMEAVDGRPVMQHLALAVAIMAAYAAGTEDAAKKSAGAAEADQAAPPAPETSPISSPPA